MGHLELGHFIEEHFVYGDIWSRGDTWSRDTWSTVKFGLGDNSSRNFLKRIETDVVKRHKTRKFLYDLMNQWFFSLHVHSTQKGYNKEKHILLAIELDMI